MLSVTVLGHAGSAFSHSPAGPALLQPLQVLPVHRLEGDGVARGVQVYRRVVCKFIALRGRRRASTGEKVRRWAGHIYGMNLRRTPNAGHPL